MDRLIDLNTAVLFNIDLPRTLPGWMIELIQLRIGQRLLLLDECNEINDEAIDIIVRDVKNEVTEFINTPETLRNPFIDLSKNGWREGFVYFIATRMLDQGYQGDTHTLLTRIKDDMEGVKINKPTIIPKSQLSAQALLIAQQIMKSYE